MNLSSEHICVYCLKVLQTPITLQCGHSVCLLCGKKLFNTAKKMLSCPTCKQITNNSAWFTLPVNYHLMKDIQSQADVVQSEQMSNQDLPFTNIEYLRDHYMTQVSTLSRQFLDQMMNYLQQQSELINQKSLIITHAIKYLSGRAAVRCREFSSLFYETLRVQLKNRDEQQQATQQEYIICFAQQQLKRDAQALNQKLKMVMSTIKMQDKMKILKLFIEFEIQFPIYITETEVNDLKVSFEILQAAATQISKETKLSNEMKSQEETKRIEQKLSKTSSRSERKHRQLQTKLKEVSTDDDATDIADFQPTNLHDLFEQSINQSFTCDIQISDTDIEMINSQLFNVIENIHKIDDVQRMKNMLTDQFQLYVQQIGKETGIMVVRRILQELYLLTHVLATSRRKSFDSLWEQYQTENGSQTLVSLFQKVGEFNINNPFEYEEFSLTDEDYMKQVCQDLFGSSIIHQECKIILLINQMLKFHTNEEFIVKYITELLNRHMMNESANLNASKTKQRAKEVRRKRDQLFMQLHTYFYPNSKLDSKDKIKKENNSIFTSMNQTQVPEYSTLYSQVSRQRELKVFEYVEIVEDVGYQISQLIKLNGIYQNYQDLHENLMSFAQTYANIYGIKQALIVIRESLQTMYYQEMKMKRRQEFLRIWQVMQKVINPGYQTCSLFFEPGVFQDSLHEFYFETVTMLQDQKERFADMLSKRYTDHLKIDMALIYNQMNKQGISLPSIQEYFIELEQLTCNLIPDPILQQKFSETFNKFIDHYVAPRFATPISKMRQQLLMPKLMEDEQQQISVVAAYQDQIKSELLSPDEESMETSIKMSKQLVQFEDEEEHQLELINNQLQTLMKMPIVQIPSQPRVESMKQNQEQLQTDSPMIQKTLSLQEQQIQMSPSTLHAKVQQDLINQQIKQQLRLLQEVPIANSSQLEPPEDLEKLARHLAPLPLNDLVNQLRLFVDTHFRSYPPQQMYSMIQQIIAYLVKASSERKQKRRVAELKLFEQQIAERCLDKKEIAQLRLQERKQIQAEITADKSIKGARNTVKGISKIVKPKSKK